MLRQLLEEHAGLLRQVNQLWAVQPTNDYDELTGLGTRRYFEARVAEELSRAERDPSCAGSLLLIDVDDVAATRARYGPAVGDRSLRWVAKVLKECLRMTDVSCRGGDRFMAVLCDSSALGAGEVAARLRAQINLAQGQRWFPGAISIGAAVWPDDAFTVSALVAIAAARLLEDRRRRREQQRPHLILLP